MAFTEQRGVDRVVDVDFGGNISTTLKLMAMNSTIAVYATDGNRNPVVPMRELMERCIALRPLVLFALPPALLAAAQLDISKWLAAGKRIHNVAAQFALSETAQAHLAVERGDKLGTVITTAALTVTGAAPSSSTQTARTRPAHPLVVAQQGLSKKVARGMPVALASLRCLAVEIVPLFDRAVAAPEAHQRDQIDLLLFAQR
jgi:hypothetical protein